MSLTAPQRPDDSPTQAKVLNISSNMARRMVEEFVAITETYQDANKALDDIRGMMSISPFVYKKMVRPSETPAWPLGSEGFPLGFDSLPELRRC